MVKKTHNFDEFDFDDFDSFGFDDGDFGVDSPKNDRTPVTRATGIAVSAAKQIVTDKQVLRDAVRGALPKGYLEAFDLADSAQENARSLYNEAMGEIAPGIRDFKKATKALLPKVETILPKKLAAKLASWSEDSEEYARYSKAQADREELSSSLTEIFDAKAQQDEAIAEQQTAESMLLDKKAANRHRTELSVLTGIQESTARLVGYQDQILAKYHRKSLELQYLQYFAQRDLLETTRESNQSILKNLVDITKNTGLPDYLKINLTEDAKKFMRQRLFGKVADGTGFGDWAGNFSANLMGKARGKMKEMSSTFNAAAAGARQVGDEAGMVDDLSPEERERLGDEVKASGLAALFSLTGVSEKLGSMVGKKYAQNESVRRTGATLSYGANNWRTMLTDFGSSETEWDNPFAFLVDSIKGTINQYSGQKMDVGNVSMLNDHNPVPFDGRAHRAISEIIPGLLSRILQSSEGIRTGEVPDLVVYNYDRGGFTEKKTAAKDAMRNIAGKHREAFNRDIDDLISNIDEGKALSPAARALLRQTLVMDVGKGGGGFDPKTYGKPSKYKGADPEVAKELAAFISSQYGVIDGPESGTNGYDFTGDDEGVIGGTKRRLKETLNGVARNFEGTTEQLERRSRDVERFNEIRASAPELGKSLSSYASAGQREILRDLGLLKKEGTADVVDVDFLWRYLGEADSDRLADLNEANNEERVQSNLAGRKTRRRPARRSFGFDSPAPVRVSSEAPAVHRQEIDPEILRGVVSTETDKLINALQEINPVERLNETNQILCQLLLTVDKIGKGIPAGDGTGGHNNEPEESGKRSLWDIRRRASFAGKWAKRGAKAAWDLSWAPARLAKATVKGAWNTGGKALNWTKDKLRGSAFDVYVKGSKTPALTRKGMLEGLYTDVKSGKLVRSIKDITGPVADQTGNQVLTEADFNTGLINAVGKEVKLRGMAIGSWLFDKATKGATLYTKLAFSPLTISAKIAKAANKLSQTWFDVYVAGEASPRLEAYKLRAGEYRSAVTQKIITKVSEIDGDVLDKAGNIVLSKTDMAKGLVDKYGRPIKSLLRRGLTKAKDFAANGIKFAARKAWAGAKIAGNLAMAPVRGLGHLGKGLKGFLKRGFKMKDDGEGGTGNGAQTEVLVGIYNLLNERMPNRKRSKFDKSGNGLRDGSWEEILQKRKEKKEADAAAKAAKGKGGKEEKPKTMWGKLLMLVGGAGAYLKSMVDKVTSIGGILKTGFTSLLEMFAKRKAIEAGADIAGDLLGGEGGGRRGPKGKGGLLKRGARLLGRGAGALGRGIMMGGTALMGGGEALAAGASAVGGGLATAATTVGGWATAAMPFLANPATWAVVGVAALAYGGYKLYRYLKERLKNLGYLRMAQYGFYESDEDTIDLIRKLEAQLEDHVKVIDGEPKFASDIPWSDILGEVGIGPENPNGVAQFMMWFKNRFIPVYLAHRKAIEQFDSSEGVITEDSVKDEAKLPIAKNTISNIPSSALGIVSHPFDANRKLTPMTDEVSKRLAALEKEFGQRGGAVKEQFTGTTVLSADGNVRTLNTQQIKDRTQKTSSTDVNMVDEAVAEKRQTEAMKAGNFVWGGADTKTIDPLGSVRMRAYGLVNLEVSDVSVLTSLEQKMFEKIKTGWFGGVSLDVDPNECYDKFSASFGCTISNAKQRQQWVYWFKNRFVPVLLTLYEAMSKANDKATIENAWRVLGPADQLKIAQAIMSATATVMGRDIPIWAVDASPFPGKPANLDSSSADVAIQSLKDRTKEKEVQEARASQQRKDPGFAKRQLEGQNSTGYGAMRPAGGGAVLGGGGTGYGPGGPGAGGTYGGGGGGSTNPEDTNYTPPAGYDHPGAGSGGDINSLPIPKGDGFNNVWPLLQQVAQMVGVDPRLLATMCGVESDFKISAKAGTSSAGGLFQFINSTWKYMLERYGSKYGIAPNTPKNDPRANSLLGAEYIRENYEYLAKSIGRKPNANDLYMAHFLGPGGAQQVLTGAPDDIAARLNPKAAAANKSVFYHNKGNGAPRTVRELMAEIDRRMTMKTGAYNIATAEMTNTGKTVEVKEKPKDPAAIPPATEAPVVEGGETNAKGGMDAVKAALPATPAPKAPVAPMSPTPTAPPVAPTAPGPSAEDRTLQRAEKEAQVVRAQAQATQQARSQERAKTDSAVKQVADGQLEKLGSIDNTLLKILELTGKIAAAQGGGVSQTSGGQSKGSGTKELRSDNRKSPISMGLG